MSELAVLRWDDNGGWRRYIVPFEPEDTVAVLKERLHERDPLLIPQRQRLLFCGQRLKAECKLREYDILPGPTRPSLYLTVGEPVTDDKLVAPAKPVFSAAFVHCKECLFVTPGKTRAFCSVCKDANVTLDSTPTSLEQQLSGMCKQCGRITAIQIFAKCAAHETTFSSPLLPNVVDNALRQAPCLQCGEGCIKNRSRPTPHVVFPSCQHRLCIECFALYERLQLNAVHRSKFAVSGSSLELGCPLGCHDSGIRHVEMYRVADADLKRFQALGPKIRLREMGIYTCPSCQGPVAPQGNQEGDHLTCPKYEDDSGGQGCGGQLCIRCGETWLPGHTCDLPNQNLELMRTAAMQQSEPFRPARATCSQCKGLVPFTGSPRVACPCGLEFCWLDGTPWSQECQARHFFIPI
eukprot:TRINITY_DN12922_c0_g1_i1.p1 TRINITY_DN12922_c0_g1~~TRINITY_DN12922_c0_g1_i1.p1  ORF type:complete len:415 (-),score=30.83 TRINITY_DN12922_c0_g1_i1:78-1301(-)